MWRMYEKAINAIDWTDWTDGQTGLTEGITKIVDGGLLFGNNAVQAHHLCFL